MHYAEGLEVTVELGMHCAVEFDMHYNTDFTGGFITYFNGEFGGELGQFEATASSGELKC